MAGPTRSPRRQWETIPEVVAQPILVTPGGGERLVGLRAETIRKYAKQPGGPTVVKISPKRLMYDRVDLLAWIERRSERVSPTASAAVTSTTEAAPEPAILEETG